MLGAAGLARRRWPGPTPLVRGSAYPKEPYIRHAHQDDEPIAYDVDLEELTEVLNRP